MPDKTALVLIDMQNAVTRHAAEPHSATEVITRVERLVDEAREVGILPIFVRTSFLSDESDSLGQPIDKGRPAKPERPAGWDRIVDELRPEPTEPIVVKRSWNAFFGSDLDLQLRRHDITTIIFAGISTNFGVEGTARSAYDRGFEIIFVEDAMASNTAKNHEFAVTEIFPMIGRVRSLETVLQSIRS